MKKLLLFVASLLTVSAWGVESIPNGSFENWDSRTYEYPDNYPFNSNTNVIRDATATFNVFKTTDKYEGTYAARLVTNPTGGENSFGYFLNGDPQKGDNPSSWTGGIPIGEKPSGITGYYKYNVAAGDTAMVIVTFSKGGVNIGTYIYPLYGVHNSYTKFDFTFTPALTQTPDSMVLGFASSWAMSEISKPGSELFIDNVSLKGVTAQPAKLNGNFETWKSTAIETLAGWTAQNENPDAFRKTTDASTGNYALEIQTYLSKEDGRNQARPSFITNGSWNDGIGNWSGGMPFKSTYTTLTFDYKYAPAQPKDTAEVWLMFKKNGQSIWYKNAFLTASATYKSVSVPVFDFPMMEAPDSVIIGIQSNRWSDTDATHVGSILKIDNMQFKEEGTIPPTPKPAIISNGGFETWDSSTFDFPENYPFNSNANRFYDKDVAINVFKTTDKHSGSYAVRLITLNDNKNGFGYFMNGNPEGDNPDSWTGGIPCNEKPTGIHGWYKYNVASGDTALIIASFSKNGTNIGTYTLPLYGVHAGYTEFNFTFTPALSVTPDSMILGFASSWAMAEIGKVGSELFVDDVTLTGVTTQPAKLNGGFETWNSETLENPQNWYIDTYNANAYKKTTDAAEGNYALEMTTFQSQDEGINIIRPATISNGYYDDNIDNWAGGTPFTNTVDTLAFYYKYAPAQPKDSAQVWVQFKKNGSFFWFNNVFLTASSTYKYVELPIAIMHPFYRPDSVIIYAQSSLWDNANQSVGSVLKIDDIHFKSRDMVTTLEPVRESADVSIFPNPSDGLFRVDLNGKEVVSVVVFNLSGQQVLSLGKTQLSANPEIDMTAFPRGVYLVRINDGNKAYVEKLILK